MSSLKFKRAHPRAEVRIYPSSPRGYGDVDLLMQFELSRSQPAPRRLTPLFEVLREHFVDKDLRPSTLSRGLTVVVIEHRSPRGWWRFRRLEHTVFERRIVIFRNGELKDGMATAH